MAYTKNVWSDRSVQYPRRYKDQSNNQYTFTPDEGTIYNEGTPVTAARMNNIENGIESLDTALSKTESIYSLSGSGTNTITATSTKITGYTTGLKVALKIGSDNTDSATLNINGLGAKGIKYYDDSGTLRNVLAGDLRSGDIIDLEYDGTQFIIKNKGYINSKEFLYSVTASGTDMITGTNYKIKAYFDGLKISLKTAGLNTTASPTLNINGYGAKNIKYYASDNTKANILAGMLYGTVLLAYDGTDFVLLNRDPLYFDASYNFKIFNNKINYKYDAGDYAVYKEDTYSGNIATTYTKVRGIKMNLSGTVTISFDLKITPSGSTGYARIYKNDAAIGTERSTASTSYVTFTESIAVECNDEISIYTKISGTGYVYITNLTVKALNAPTIFRTYHYSVG